MIKFLLFLFSTLFFVISPNVFADEIGVPVPCQRLFNEAEALVSNAEKQPGTHPNLAEIREKFNTSKAQILQLERELQIKSCYVGLAKLNETNHSDELLNG